MGIEWRVWTPPNQGQVCHRVSRFSCAEGAYALLATGCDECTPLPGGVRISLRG